MKYAIYWVGVKTDNQLISNKHGNFDYFEYSLNTWKWWCAKYGVDLIEYNETSKPSDFALVNWQRWFDLPDIAGEKYDGIALVDASTMISTECPNFFKLCDLDKVTVFHAQENYDWISKSADGYHSLFPESPQFPLNQYFNSGFQIFGKNHVKWLKEVFAPYYSTTKDTILSIKNSLKRGTDQPVMNWLYQTTNVPLAVDALSRRYFLMHLARFDWMHNNWQLNDPTPHFIKWGYIWCFSGVDRTLRNDLMKSTWDLVKNEYE